MIIVSKVVTMSTPESQEESHILSDDELREAIKNVKIEIKKEEVNIEPYVEQSIVTGSFIDRHDEEILERLILRLVPGPIACEPYYYSSRAKSKINQIANKHGFNIITKKQTHEIFLLKKSNSTMFFDPAALSI